ncbi:hypothetical protein PENFLA_c015G03996 [Penicillium flavigenum]|uniref:Uncharacterized protein n=1 Tax=Penicillium flavigenum TaxID=254877 RepID=A0A1V6T505_9EURO|nr:hypothetical protein PENFLA_c015G03996 [Penicillium flavigenum]
MALYSNERLIAEELMVVRSRSPSPARYGRHWYSSLNTLLSLVESVSTGREKFPWCRAPRSAPEWPVTGCPLAKVTLKTSDLKLGRVARLSGGWSDPHRADGPEVNGEEGQMNQ